MSIIKSLLKLADQLDTLGHTKEADKLDVIIRMAGKARKKIRKTNPNLTDYTQTVLNPTDHLMGPSGRRHTERSFEPTVGRTGPKPHQVTKEEKPSAMPPKKPTVPPWATEEQKEAYEDRLAEWEEEMKEYEAARKKRMEELAANAPVEREELPPRVELMDKQFDAPFIPNRDIDELLRNYDRYLSKEQMDKVDLLKRRLKRLSSAPMIPGEYNLYEDGDTGSFFVLHKSKLKHHKSEGKDLHRSSVNEVIRRYLAGKPVTIH